MHNLTVVDFPNAVDPVCKLFIKVSYSGKTTDLIGFTQAIFDSYESWKKFDSSIYLHNKYTIIRVSNCEQNTQPIIMKIEKMPSNFFFLNDFYFLVKILTIKKFFYFRKFIQDTH